MIVLGNVIDQSLANDDSAFIKIRINADFNNFYDFVTGHYANDFIARGGFLVGCLEYFIDDMLVIGYHQVKDDVVEIVGFLFGAIDDIVYSLGPCIFSIDVVITASLGKILHHVALVLVKSVIIYIFPFAHSGVNVVGDYEYSVHVKNDFCIAQFYKLIFFVVDESYPFDGVVFINVQKVIMQNIKK